MAAYGMNDVQNGMKVMIEGEPCVIIDVDFVKPPKGPPRTHIRHRNIRTGRVADLILWASNRLEAADVLDVELEFLYTDDELWHFMHPKTHEQFFADKAAMANAAPWLTGNETCTVTLWNESVLKVVPPNFVELVIAETDPGLRGDTSSGGTKSATLETGAVVRVPLFVAQRERIRVDTRTGANVARVR